MKEGEESEDTYSEDSESEESTSGKTADAVERAVMEADTSVLTTAGWRASASATVRVRYVLALGKGLGQVLATSPVKNWQHLRQPEYLRRRACLLSVSLGRVTREAGEDDEGEER